MFVTMAVDHLLTSFILLLISNTGFSAEISVFVQTGDSVQLDIQTHELPEFDDLSWINDKSENIVKYIHASKTVRSHPSYKDRVDFNDKTFSLTLKNMQKTDSGLYTARTSGETEKNIVTYRVSVIDAVEAPVLTVNSNWSSSDSCTVNFTCRAHDLMIHSSYQNNSCSPEEVTSHDIYTLILNCSEESIICNHSNPVSWKKDRINITQLCKENERLLIPSSSSSSYIHFVLIIVFGVVGVIVFSGLVLFCCCMYKGVKQSDDTDYDDVEKMTGDTWTRKRWKSLRDTYLKERRKESEKRSGSAAESAKRWKYSAVLSFLDPFVSPRETSGNMESRDRDEQTAGYDHPDQAEAAAGLSETGEPTDFLECSEPGSPPPEPESPLPEPAAASPAQAGPSSAAAAVPTVPPSRRRRRPQEESINFEKELLSALRSRPQPPPCSEDEHFLLSLLPSLQKLPPQTKELVKFQMHKLIYESSTVVLNLETLDPTE